MVGRMKISQENYRNFSQSFGSHETCDKFGLVKKVREEGKKWNVTFAETFDGILEETCSSSCVFPGPLKFLSKESRGDILLSPVYFHYHPTSL